MMRTAAIGALLAAALGISACETYYDGRGYDDSYGAARRFGDYAYTGRGYQRVGNECGFFVGSGGDLLDPWLACTREGQAIVRSMFDRYDNARISRETADRANIWFRRTADRNRDLRLTDREIRAALSASGRRGPPRRY